MRFDPPTYLMLTDAPPLAEGAHGCHVIARNWLEAMGAWTRLVVTHRLSSELDPVQIRAGLGHPLLMYPDLCRVRVPGRLQSLKAGLEVFLFAGWLMRRAGSLRAAAAERLFAFFGGNPWFLWLTWMTARSARLPLDIYLVDDLEESARLGRQPAVAKMVRWLEPRLLQRADRVFAISPGFCEHLARKYRIQGRWLPVVMPDSHLAYQPFERENPDIRRITFVGAVNDLYAAALRDLLGEIEAWNRNGSTYQLRLQLLTYTAAEVIRSLVRPSPCCEVILRSPEPEFRRRLRQSWAVFLPYSFAPEVRVMVRTSFPSKVVAGWRAGRPLLVYGPPDASVVRHFRAQGLPLCVDTPGSLRTALGEIAALDSPELINRYQAIVRCHHSIEAVQGVLADVTATSVSPTANP